MKPDPPQFEALSIGGKCPGIKGPNVILSDIRPATLKLIVEDLRDT